MNDSEILVGPRPLQKASLFVFLETPAPTPSTPPSPHFNAVITSKVTEVLQMPEESSGPPQRAATAVSQPFSSTKMRHLFYASPMYFFDADSLLRHYVRFDSSTGSEDEDGGRVIAKGEIEDVEVRIGVFSDRIFR